MKIVLVVLIALAVGSHFQSANTFRRAWNVQRQFFWELSWRIPGLKPGTMLISHELPLQFYSDYSLSAPLNMIYAPDYRATEPMPYLLLYTKARLKGSLVSLESGTSVDFNYRATTFEGNTKKSVVIYYPYPACLRVMDNRFTNKNSIQDLPYQLTDAILLSNLGNIIKNPEHPVVPPKSLFGSEPSHGWCYYFYKAELARQENKWETVISLLDDANNLGLKPIHQSELLPFVEAYVRTGRWQTALEMAQAAIQTDPSVRTGFCQTFIRIVRDEEPNPPDRDLFNSFNKEFNCGY